MSEQISQFDFSKKENQEKFDNLSKKDQEAYIQESQEETEYINSVRDALLSASINTFQIEQIKNEIQEKFPDKFQKIIALPEIQEASFEGIKKHLREGRIDIAIKTQ